MTTPPANSSSQPSHQLLSQYSLRAWVVLALVVILGVATDLGSKYWAFHRVAGQPVTLDRQQTIAAGPGRLDDLIPHHDAVPFIPHVLEFRLVLNPGAVFGIGAGKRWFFVLFTGLALGFASFMFARWTRARDHALHVALGLIIAGGIGNLYDRLLYACVRDFLSFLPKVDLPLGLSWPSGDTRAWPWVSNIADAFLILGVVTLIIHTLRTPPHRTISDPADNTKSA